MALLDEKTTAVEWRLWIFSSMKVERVIRINLWVELLFNGTMEETTAMNAEHIHSGKRIDICLTSSLGLTELYTINGLLFLGQTCFETHVKNTAI